jgi:putative membrane protein
MYKLTDLLMKHNLVGKVKEQAQMETELKAIIYQYMYRMVHDKLLAK